MSRTPSYLGVYRFDIVQGSTPFRMSDLRLELRVLHEGICNPKHSESIEKVKCIGSSIEIGADRRLPKDSRRIREKGRLVGQRF
jgi:hypothetical protein